MGYEARNGPRQHDANHQPAHGVADAAAARCVGRKMGREGYDDLRGDAGEADQKRRRKHGARRRRINHSKQGEDRNREAGRDEAAAFQYVAERDHEDQAEAVADLRKGDEKPDRGRVHRQLSADDARDGLHVIKVGDDETACGRQEETEGLRQFSLALFDGAIPASDASAREELKPINTIFQSRFRLSAHNRVKPRFSQSGGGGAELAISRRKY
jgi:hypothetical protein